MYFSETTGKKLKCKTQNMEMHSVKKKINVFNDSKKDKYKLISSLAYFFLSFKWRSQSIAKPIAFDSVIVATLWVAKLLQPTAASGDD